MTSVSIKGLVPSFAISEQNRGIELLFQGEGFSNLEGQKIDIAIESGGGVRWIIDPIFSGRIELEGKTFFMVNAAPVRESFSEGDREYTDLTIMLRTNGHIISRQTVKVFYSDPIIG